MEGGGAVVRGPRLVTHTADLLIVTAEDGRLVLEPRERVLQSLVGMFAPGPEGGVDELIAARRREFEREEAELNGEA